MANPDEHVGKSWYLGKISKEKSRELLETFGEEGDYIVRDSETRVSRIIANFFFVSSKTFDLQFDFTVFTVKVGAHEM